MKRIADGEYTFKLSGTDYHLRAYIDTEHGEKPVLIVHEPNDNRGSSLNQSRTDLAIYLASCLNTTPDQVRYFEQGARGDLTQVEFSPYRVEQRPYANELPPDDVARLEKAGHLRPTIFTGYNQAERAATVGALEAEVGEKLRVPESYADRQNWEFSQLRGPDPQRFTPDPEFRPEA